MFLKDQLVRLLKQTKICFKKNVKQPKYLSSHWSQTDINLRVQHVSSLILLIIQIQWTQETKVTTFFLSGPGIGFVTQFMFMPLCAFALTYVFPSHMPEMRLGLFVTGIYTFYLQHRFLEHSQFKPSQVLFRVFLIS